MVDEVMKFITEADPEVGEAIEAEAARQRRNLELIASENIVSEPVMMAMGSVLTNKYAEGYPGKRYYGGCQCVDVVESIAIERAKKLFGCDYANVQPHSGAQANMAEPKNEWFLRTASGAGIRSCRRNYSCPGIRYIWSGIRQYDGWSYRPCPC